MNILKTILKDLGMDPTKNPYRTDDKFEEFNPKKDGLYQHALLEYKILGQKPDFAMVGVLELIATLSMQGHSGSSVHWALSQFCHLASFGALSPLTGKEDEWGEDWNGPDGQGARQNRRLFGVFQRRDLTAYDVDAWRVQDKTGYGFTVNRPVAFPYTRRKIVITVDLSDDIGKKSDQEWAEIFKVKEFDEKLKEKRDEETKSNKGEKG